jgi:PASTA domain/Divergent InlB B-repeat domain
MSLFVARLRAVGRRRGVLVLAVSLAVVAAVEAGVVAAGPSPHGIAVRPDGPVPRAPAPAPGSGKRVIVGHSYRNDSSRPVRSLPRSVRPVAGFHTEASPNPRPVSRHRDALDAVRQTRQFASKIPGPKLNFDGIAFPGVDCNCVPPDTNGEAGLTQYVQIVNQGFQVFSKSTGAALTPATDIAALWNGFGGVCENSGFGDPIVMYDQLANRWLISQFAGTSVPTDECIAISTTSDATGTWNRYGFHLGTDFFDYPHLGVWPDAYYMSMNVFDASDPNPFLGPQPFAFDRAAMLAGNPATFVTTRDPSVFDPNNDSMLPADLDGSTLPPAGAPNPFLMSGPFNSTWPLWRFHVDFATPANSTFTLGGTLTPASFTALCLNASNCVPQAGVTSGDYLDALADRGMFRLAYRNFGSREALVGNMTVQSNGVAGIRWYEINHATSGAPSFVQQSTYQPDTTWRWMGSVAMDRFGNLALGFSASSPAMHPAIRYAGRLVGDPANTLAQGEATLLAGAGSQEDTPNNRWGDYSDLTVDPVDDCTFWYTQEYYQVTSSFNWRTRIGSFRLHGCASTFSVTTIKNGTGAGTVTSSPAGVRCGSTCSAGFDDRTPMTLTATPAVGSDFTGWSGGGCAGAGVCTFVLNGAKTVTATFSLQKRGLTVVKKGNGRGSVASSPGGIGCPSACLAQFFYGTLVKLTAKPTATSVFSGWGNACAGKSTCALSMTVDRAATATFRAKCVVPKLLGLTLKKAKARIKRAHCTVGKITRKRSVKSKRGKVLTQKPKPGKRLAPGAKVNLTVGRS